MKVGDLVTWVGHTGFGGRDEIGLVMEVHEQEWAADKEPYNLLCPVWLVVLWSNGDIQGIGEDDVKPVEKQAGQNLTASVLDKSSERDTLLIEPEQRNK